MRLVIGTDGSEDALAAAGRAIGLLAPADTIVLVAVVDPPAEESAGLESGFAGGVADPGEIAIAWAAVEATANAILDRTAETIRPSLADGVTVERRIEYGSPGPDVCRVASEVDADVVAVGSRGQGRLRRALLGSVSTHVVNNAPCAVLVIRAGTA